MQDDVQIIATIYENVEDYMVTSMDVALLVEIAEATNMSDIEIKNIPGKGVDGDEFDEYYINEEQLYELIIQMFYEEI
jgi:anionic cell wall polymer biosynthesis LytR-Cps2A-Psr (LCP) family protein